MAFWDLEAIKEAFIESVKGVFPEWSNYFDDFLAGGKEQVVLGAMQRTGQKTKDLDVPLSLGFWLGVARTACTSRDDSWIFTQWFTTDFVDALDADDLAPEALRDVLVESLYDGFVEWEIRDGDEGSEDLVQFMRTLFQMEANADNPAQAQAQLEQAVADAAVT